MESDTIRWKNEHNLFVNTGLASQAQTQAAVDVAKKEIVKMFPGQDYEKCEYIVNLVMDSKGNSYKYAYLWVSDPRVYYIFAGFNPDGSERFEEEKKEKTITFDDSFDLDDLDLEGAFTAVSKVKKPTIRTPLPPLITLPGYEYTLDQKKKAEEDLKAEAVSKGRNLEEIKVPDYGYFEVSRAWAGTPKKNENPCILCSYVPLWVNEEILKKIFFRYSSDKSGIYPKISFKIPKKRESTHDFAKRFEDTPEKKLAIVEFSKSYHRDGVFALQMTRKVVIRDTALEAKLKKETGSIEPKLVTMIFEHFKNSEPSDDASGAGFKTVKPVKNFERR